MSLYQRDPNEMVAHHIDEGEEVGCYFCMESPWRNPQPSYKRGEAFLCGPEWPPFNAEANYICLEHVRDLEASYPQWRFRFFPADVPPVERIEPSGERKQP